MQMIDVLKRLQEIQDRSPEVAKAISSVERMVSETPVNEAVRVDLTGSDAILGQILKLAGMVGAETNIDLASGPTTIAAVPTLTPGPMDNPLGAPGAIDKPLGSPDVKMGGVASPSMDVELPDEPGMPPEMPKPVMPKLPSIKGALEAEGGRPYDNSPKERTMGLRSAVPDGNDLNRSKLTAPKVAGADNPMHVAVTFD